MSENSGPLGTLRASDTRMILATMLGIYALFVLFGVVLFPRENLVGSLASTLQRITFLTAAYAMLALALNLHWGYAGLFNIGVAGFMAVGVYTMAILTNPPTMVPPGLGLPLPVGIVGGMVVAALVGALASLPALRLRADYLAIVTIGLSEIIRLSLLSQAFETFTLFANLNIPLGPVEILPDLKIGTGAGRGINLPTNPVRTLYYRNPDNPGSGLTAFGDVAFEVLGSVGIRPSVVVAWTYTLVLVGFVGLFYWLLVRVGNSPFGRVLKAIREDEEVAQSLGKDTRWVKVKVFMLGCALMGLAGILWEGAKGFTDPTSTTFLPLQTFYIFIALIIGGAGSNTGSVLGGMLFVGFLFEGPLMITRIVRKYLALGAVNAPTTFADALGALGSLDLIRFLAFVTGRISSLRFVIVGIVLVALVQRRPEGLLGHRKETAASIDLMDRRTDASGGESDE